MQDFKKISEHVSIMGYGENDNPVMAYIHGKYGAVVVDGGASRKQALKFRSFLGENEKNMLKAVLVTHHHWDHVFGLEGLDIPVICGESTLPWLEHMSKCQWKQKDMDEKLKEGEIFEFTYNNMKNELGDDGVKLPIPLGVSGKTVFFLGDADVIYSPIDSCHCDDCHTIYVKEDKILFLGDALWPNMESAVSQWYYSMESVKSMYEILMGYDADYFIDSHDDMMDRKHFDGFMKKLIFMLEYSFNNRGCSYGEIEKSVPEELKNFKTGYDEWLETAIVNCRE